MREIQNLNCFQEESSIYLIIASIRVVLSVVKIRIDFRDSKHSPRSPLTTQEPQPYDHGSCALDMKKYMKKNNEDIKNYLTAMLFSIVGILLPVGIAGFRRGKVFP